MINILKLPPPTHLSLLVLTLLTYVVAAAVRDTEITALNTNILLI